MAFVILVLYCFYQKIRIFHARIQSLNAQIKFKSIEAIIYAVVFLVIFSGCAGVDGWLEGDISAIINSEPVAIFECDVQKFDRDALILLGIKDSSLITGYHKWKTICFFLKDTNTDRSTSQSSIENESRFIQFIKVDNKFYDDFSRDLSKMEIYAVYLKKQTVKQDSLLRFKTLGDGDLRNMLPRQLEYIKNRTTHFVVINLAIKNSNWYQKQVENTFQRVSH